MSVAQVVPRSAAFGAACLLAALGLAGCGGSAKPPQAVRGDGFGFTAPGGWKVTRTGQTVQATHGQTGVFVTTYRLTRRYTPALWAKATKELDGVATTLAAQLHGSPIASRTVQVGPTKSRQYDIAFTRNGHKLVERITFVLRGRREYELLCRFKQGKTEPACALLQSSFHGG